MDEKQLQFLFDNYAKGKGFSDYGEFKSLMQDSASRKVFFEDSNKELGFTDYNDFENTIGVKKKVTSNVAPTTSGSGLSSTPKAKDPLQEYLNQKSKERKENVGSDLVLPKNVSTNETKIAKETAVVDRYILNKESEESKKRNNELVRKQALELTAKRSKRTEAEVQKDVDEGKLILSSDGKGNKIYARQPGAGETFIRGLSSSINSLVDAGTIAAVKATGSPEELAATYELIALRKRQEAEKEFTLEDITNPLKSLPSSEEVKGLPTAAPGVVGTLTEMGGHLAPDIAMAAGTGGLNIAAKTGVIGSKMYASSYGNKAYELYERGKEEALKSGMDEKDASIYAAKAATENATTAALPDAAVNTLFFSGKLHSPVANNFISVMKGAAKDAVKVGALGSAGSLTTSAIEGAQGYNVEDWIDKALESGGEFAKMDLLFKVLPILRTLPKATQSAVKEFAVDPVVKPLVEAQLKTLQSDIANNIANDLAAYEAATKDVRGIVPEEKMASIGGRMQKRQNRLNGIEIIKNDIKELEAKKKDLPEQLHEEIDATIKEREGQMKSLEKEIEQVDKEIGEINKSKESGLEKEVDEATGEPIIPKEQVSTVSESEVDDGNFRVGKINKPDTITTVEQYKEYLKSALLNKPTAKFDGIEKTLEKAEQDILNDTRASEKSKHLGVEAIKQLREENGIEPKPTVSSEVKEQLKSEKKDADNIQNKPIPENTETGTGSAEPIKAEEILTPKETVIEISEGGGEPPKEEVVGSGIYSEPKRTVFSHRGLQEVATEFGLDHVTSRERVSDAQLFRRADETLTKWQEEGSYNKNIKELMKRGEEKKPISDEENVIMAQHIAQLREQGKKVRQEFGVNSKEYDTKLAEINDAVMVGEAIRSQQGAALRVPIFSREYMPTLEDAMTAKMDAVGTDVLTPKQKVEVEKQFEKIEKERDEYKAKLEAANAKFAEMQAQIELSKPASKGKTTTGKRDYKAERQSLKDRLKEELAAYKAAGQKMGIASDGGAESFVVSAKIAKTITEIARTHVAETGAKIKEVVEKTLEDVKEYFGDNITDRDIMDVLAGKYNEKRKTRSQLAADMREVQTEAKLLQQYESLLKKEPQSEKDKIKQNKRLKDLRDKIKELQKEQGVGQYSDAEKAKRAIERNKQREQEIREKINNKDFDEKKKPVSFWEEPSFKKNHPDLYKEVLDSYNKKEEAQLDYELELLKDAEAKKTKTQKVLDWLGRGANTTKKVVTGIDDSSLFMQTLAAMTARPLVAGQAIRLHALDAFSKKRFDRNLAELHNSPDWDLMKKSGLDVTEPKSLTAAAHEEAFAGKSWDITFKKGGKEYKVLQTMLSPFERAFTSLGNGMRVIAFRSLVEKFEREGHTFENNPQLYKDLATMLNTETGRGKQNELIERASNLVTKGIWSPRLMASRLNMLGISDAISFIPGMDKAGTKGYYRQLTPEIRKQALKDLVKFSATVVAVSHLVAYAVGGEVDNDPDSVTYLDIKTPDGKSYNISGGFAQYIKLVAQTIAGGKRKEGQFQEFKGEKSEGSNIMRFGRGKLTPLAGVITDFATGKDFSGKEVTPLEEAKKLAIPLSLQSVAAEMERDGLSSLLTATLPSFVGIQVKDERDFQKSTGNKKGKPEKKEKKPKPEKSY